MKWNEERVHYDFGDIDWGEFWKVVGGNGPCNKQRLKTRKRAYDEGECVREAASVFAEKKRMRKS